MCLGTPVDAQLLKLVQDELANLVKETETMKDTAKEEIKKVKASLQNIKSEVDLKIDELTKKVDNLSLSSEEHESRLDAVEETQIRAHQHLLNVQENTDQRISEVQSQQQAISFDYDALQAKHNILDGRVAGIEEKQVQLESKVCDLAKQCTDVPNSTSACHFYAPDRNTCFCGRANQLKYLGDKAAMAFSGCVTTAICGLGGVGKSTLAVEHVWSHKQEYTGGVFHVSGENPKLFQISLNEMARSIGTRENEFKETLSATLHWLQNCANPWCLVVDNLDEVELSDDMMKLLNGKWRRDVRGLILITSRREPTVLVSDININATDCIELESLSEDEAVAFMEKRTENYEEEKALHDLVGELGYLPLALEQAAAYIIFLQCSFTDYFEEYKKRRLDLLKERKGHYMENTSRERLAVHTTWLMNFEYLSKVSKDGDAGVAAVLVMEVSAFLSPESIPFEIVNSGLPVIDNRALQTSVQSDFGTKAVLSLLTKFSLFRRLSKNSYSVHRLVQEVIRDNIDVRRKPEVLRRALRMLHYAFVGTKSPADVCHESSVETIENSGCRPLLHLWGNLASHAYMLQEHVASFAETHQDPELHRKLLHQKEAARIFGEAAVYLSLCHDQVKALELQRRKLECQGHVDGGVQQERTDELLLPLSEQNSRVISKCLKNVSDNARIETQVKAADLKRVKQDSIILRQEGNKLVQEKNFSKAEETYTQAINIVAAIAPSQVDTRLYANRAVCYLNLGQPAKALGDCDKALELVQTVNELTLKVYHRKAWALHRLVTDGKDDLRYRAKAAAVRYNYYSAKLNDGKVERKRFPQEPFFSVSNAIELLQVISTSPPETSLLLLPGEYKFSSLFFDRNLCMIGLEKGEVKLNCRTACAFAGNVYVENVSFPPDSCSVVVGGGTECTFYGCSISGGFTACEEYPECNGGVRCVAPSRGKPPCNRQYDYGDRQNPSGIKGFPAMRICSASKVNIEDCEVSSGGSFGLIVNDEHSELVVNNSAINNNVRGGIQAMEGGSMEIMNCLVYKNGEEGVLVGERAGTCKIKDNTIFDNGRDGIIISTTKKKTLVQGNKICHNQSFGASFHGCSALICHNEIFENTFWGIGIEQGSTALISNNIILRNKCGGICISTNFSGRVTIKENEVRDHAGPWLFFAREEAKGVPVTTFLGVKEADIYTAPPTLINNRIENNIEGFCHPQNKVLPFGNFCTCCHGKGAANLSRCAGCRTVVYCSKKCQLRHWQQHKQVCLRLTERYSLTVDQICKQDIDDSKTKHVGSNMVTVSIEMVPSNLKGLGKGPGPDRTKKQRFIVKLQTWHVNSHPLQPLRLYDKSMTVDCYIQSPVVHNFIMECGVLGSLAKLTSKKVFMWATFADDVRKITLFLDELAPYQDW